MIVFKRRLIIWLIRAYIKKWGKVIVISFLAGLAIFFILFSTSSFLIKLIPIEKKSIIGVAGDYTVDQLPPFIVNKISVGLTTIDDKGHVKPGLAKSWDITDKGHTYTFHLNKQITFSDGQPLTSNDINYAFSDVKIDRPDPETIVYQLKEVYAPFLVTVSRPVLKNNFVGAGPYKLEDVELNGTFLSTITLISVKNKLFSQKYVFYANSDILKIAFLLGEVTSAYSLTDTTYHHTNISNYPNVTLQKTTDYNQLVTLFMNTQDSELSDNQIRSAIGYAMPNTFSEGERSYLPYPPQTWYFNSILPDKTQDFAHAKLLLEADHAKVPTLTIQTLPKYEAVGEIIVKNLAQIGIKAKLVQVNTIPAKFQLYLGDFTLPQDPDQYALWHENEPNNITQLIDKRIDKFLEDGRQTINEDDRKQIYDDFQKYLSDRAPAIFLYFPYVYTVSRK